jgi:hypothetical protein
MMHQDFRHQISTPSKQKKYFYNKNTNQKNIYILDKNCNYIFLNKNKILILINIDKLNSIYKIEILKYYIL